MNINIHAHTLTRVKLLECFLIGFQKRGMFYIMSLVGGIKLPDHFFGIISFHHCDKSQTVNLHGAFLSWFAFGFQVGQVWAHYRKCRLR